jgi:uncharacterized protein (DUF58 family)
MMLTREILRQVRRLHLRARRAVEDPLGGAYRSVFKGSGISFEEVREYQPGDDIRGIDWKVTARMGHPFVKRFIEERELTVMLLLDASASMSFGSFDASKREVAAEVAALLTLCAVGSNDKIGLVLTSDIVEACLPPRKTTRHALRLIRDLFVFKPTRPGTNVGIGLDYLLKILKRRALVFIFSDFLDGSHDKALKRAAHRHDVVAVKIEDPLDVAWPDVGLVETVDLESGRTMLIDTSDADFRASHASRRRDSDLAFEQLAKAHGIDVLTVSTGGDHLDALIRFFRIRERRLNRA